MQKTVVINVVGLTSSLLGEYTPFLTSWSANATKKLIKPVLPALTCTAQSTYLTGQLPEQHGIVGNGWYCRNECEVKFWKQSNKLVQSNKIWEVAKKLDKSFTCANMFWWYNMYSNADYSVTPRPVYLSDGRKIPDIYSHPANLRALIQKRLGIFPLFNFWGPKASIRSSQWIAEASKIVEQKHAPTLILIYLPHLDYNLQRYGPGDIRIKNDLSEIDTICKDLVNFYEQKGANVIVISEYGITAVDHPIALNRILREHGFITIREERGKELLDTGASKAFAVADHQIAHIYVKDKKDIAIVRNLVEIISGIQEVMGEKEKSNQSLFHERLGELIAIADARSWFTYYYWMIDRKAPDFSRTVDIHRKPGYDPVELFTDPKIKLLKPLIVAKLLKKKFGFRMLMDIIPLDASLVKGSHGRIPESVDDWPILISKKMKPISPSSIEAKDVFDIILSHLKGV